MHSEINCHDTIQTALDRILDCGTSRWIRTYALGCLGSIKQFYELYKPQDEFIIHAFDKISDNLESKWRIGWVVKLSVTEDWLF